MMCSFFVVSGCIGCGCMLFMRSFRMFAGRSGVRLMAGCGFVPGSSLGSMAFVTALFIMPHYIDKIKRGDEQAYQDDDKPKGSDKRGFGTWFFVMLLMAGMCGIVC